LPAPRAGIGVGSTELVEERRCRLCRRAERGNWASATSRVGEEDGHLSIVVARPGEIYDRLRQDRPTGRRS
jgi:hypothetical protein